MNEELKIIISAEIDKFKKNVDEAKKKINSFSDQVEKAKKDVDGHIAKMGEGIKKGLDVGIKAFGAATAAVLALGPATAEYRGDMAKLVSGFEAAGSSAEEAKNTYNDLYRVLGESDRSVEAANHIAKLTQNQQHMAEWTNICQGVFATFGDSLPIEGLTEAANETAKVGTLTGVLADALNWAGVNEDKFNESLAACNTEAEREALIRSTLNGIYDDAAKKFEANNAQVIAQNEANAQLQASLAAIGEAVAPVVTAFTQLANEALAALLPHIQSFAENYGPQLVEVLTKAGELTGQILGFLVDNWEMIAGLAAIIAGISAAVGLYNAVAAVKAAMAAAEVTTVWALVSAYAAQAVAVAAAMLPYIAIVAAIAAVIAIIVLCIKHWDDIKAAIGKAWDWIKEKTSQAVNNVVGKVTEMKDNFINKVNEAKTRVLSIFDNIKNGMRDKINGARDFVKTAIDKIKSFFNFTWSLPKLKLPHVSISGSFSLMPPSVPKFSISWYAKGGVFDKPMLFPYGNSIGGLGEDGAEAVVPLEKNTQWLDKIAERLAEKTGGTPIILEVDGKTFAQTSISTINQLTRQSGKLELNLY